LRGTIVVLLLVYAAAVATAGSRWLPRASWPLRAPRAAIAAWQAATLSVIASVVAAGLILAVPCLRISTDPAVLRACLSLMWARGCAGPDYLVHGHGDSPRAAPPGTP